MGKKGIAKETEDREKGETMQKREGSGICSNVRYANGGEKEGRGIGNH